MISILPKYLLLAAVVASALFPLQEVFAQQQLPDLKTVENKKFDRIDGISGYRDLEIALSLSNVTTETVTVFGQNFNGKFSPIGTSYSIDPEQRKRVYADEAKTILKLNGRSYTASRTVKPGDTLRFSIFVYIGNASCIKGLHA